MLGINFHLTKTKRKKIKTNDFHTGVRHWRKIVIVCVKICVEIWSQVECLGQ